MGSGQKKLRSPRVSKIHVLNVIQIIKQIKHISSVGFFCHTKISSKLTYIYQPIPGTYFVMQCGNSGWNKW